MPEDTVKATLYITRHGECTGNVTQVALDPFTDLLTDVGKEQAKLLGEQLKSIPFTRAYASDYPRTLETAETILKQTCRTKLQAKPEKGLRERGYTGLIGKPASIIINMMTDVMKDGTPYLKVDLPNCEPTGQFEDRIIKFFSALIQDLRKSEKDEEKILLVSHALTIQRLMVLLNNRSEEFGIQNWTKNRLSERLMRNTTHHRIGLEIPRDEKGPVSGRVEHAHFREHVDEESNDSSPNRDIKDKNNYTFLEEEDLKNYDETTHYCTPV